LRDLLLDLQFIFKTLDEPPIPLAPVGQEI
jgi:hypothetical protein